MACTVPRRQGKSLRQYLMQMALSNNRRKLVLDQRYLKPLTSFRGSIEYFKTRALMVDLKLLRLLTLILEVKEVVTTPTASKMLSMPILVFITIIARPTIRQTMVTTSILITACHKVWTSRLLVNTARHRRWLSIWQVLPIVVKLPRQTLKVSSVGTIHILVLQFNQLVLLQMQPLEEVHRSILEETAFLLIPLRMSTL